MDTLTGCMHRLIKDKRTESVLFKVISLTAFITLLFRESLCEIFYRCDLDGNGFLSRKEFGLFQLKTSEEECDDDAWDVVKGLLLTQYCTLHIYSARH